MINYKLYELIEQDTDTIETYNQLFSFVPPSDYFLKKQARQLELMTFGEVSELKKRALNLEIFYLVRNVFDVKEDDILKSRCTDFFPARNYINLQLENLIKREQKMLFSRMDTKLAKAGIERLNVLGDANVTIDLGQAFGVRPSEIEQWPYAEVFAIRLKNKLMSEIEMAIK
jgi:hypothetical protein